MRTSTRLFLVMVCGLSVIQCSKSPDFLYLEATEPAFIQYTESRKIKEMDGNDSVDMLWIIDNSGSMGDDHANLIANTSSFISQFVQYPDVRWKIGIISTDTAQQPFLGFQTGDELTWNTADPVSKFQKAVGKLGTNGSGFEKAYEPMVNALNKFPNFARPGALLAVIVVTDEDEQSTQYNGTTALKYLENLKGNLKSVLGYGVFADSALGCQGGFTYKNSQYEPFMKGLKNKIFPLCSPKFGQDLAALGADIVKFIKNRRFELPVRPIPETIKITYLGTEVKGGLKHEGGHWIYDYDLNAIVFWDLDFAPGQNEEVVVTYEAKNPKKV